MRHGEVRSLAARPDVCCDDILCTLLGLRRLQAQIYRLLEGGEMDVPNIAAAVRRDRTSVQRAAQDLVTAGLVTRRELPSERGRKYGYRGIDSKLLRERLLSELEAYYKRLRRELEAGA
jgi:predicted transcriptional regulator